MKKALWCILSLSATLAWPAMAEEPISIGVYVPLSGRLCPAGRAMWEGIQVAHRMRPRVLNRPVMLRVADTKSDKAEAADAVFRLIERERVSAVIGELVSGNTIAGSFHTERSGIPMVTPTASSPLVTRRKRYVFSLSPVDSDHAKQAVDLALHRFSAGSAAVVWDMSQECSVGQAACFRRRFSQAGGRVVADIGCRMEDRDFSVQISRIMKGKPDVIYAPMNHEQCALIARQARAMGLNAPIIASGAVHVPELIELGGKSVENLLLTGHFHEGMIRTELGRRFRNLHAYVTGKPLQTASVFGADAYLLILDAIARANSSDPDAIREALSRTGEFESLLGRISTAKTGRADERVFVFAVRNGEFAHQPETVVRTSPRAHVDQDKN